MSTQETETPEQRAAKRVRIDKNPEVIGVQKVEAPSQAATNFVAKAVESRQEPVRNLFKRLAQDFVNLKAKQRQLNSTRARLSDEELIPRSCRFKFDLKASEYVMKSPRFVTIVEAANEDMKAFQKKMKARIVECLDLEIKMTEERVCETFLSAIHKIATLHIIAKHPKTDPHENDVLKLCAHAIKSTLSQSVFANIASHPPRVSFTAHFVTQMKRDDDTPLIINNELTDQQIHDQWTTTPTDIVAFNQYVVDVEKDLKIIFVDSWKAYKERQNNAEIERALAKKVQELTTTKATEETAMVIDAEPAVEPKKMKEIVAKEVKKSIKNLRKDINSLKQSNQRNNNGTPAKNTTGGAKDNGASTPTKKKSKTKKQKAKEKKEKARKNRQGQKTNDDSSAENSEDGSQRGKGKKKRNNKKGNGKKKSRTKQPRQRRNSTSSTES